MNESTLGTIFRCIVKKSNNTEEYWLGMQGWITFFKLKIEKFSFWVSNPFPNNKRIFNLWFLSHEQVFPLRCKLQVLLRCFFMALMMRKANSWANGIRRSLKEFLIMSLSFISSLVSTFSMKFSILIYFPFFFEVKLHVCNVFKVGNWFRHKWMENCAWIFDAFPSNIEEPLIVHFSVIKKLISIFVCSFFLPSLSSCTFFYDWQNTEVI